MSTTPETAPATTATAIAAAPTPSITESKWSHPTVASLSLSPCAPHQLYINGRWVPASADATTFALVNPATEQVIANIPNATTADVDVACKVSTYPFNYLVPSFDKHSFHCYFQPIGSTRSI
jgi:hypothetical protein